MASTVPKPGPANLRPGAGLDEWLEEAKRCHYLPEAVMKQLCEMVKEVLMEGMAIPVTMLQAIRRGPGAPINRGLTLTN